MKWNDCSLICLFSKMGGCMWCSVPFLLFPMLVISKYNKQNSLCMSSPWRQLIHWCFSSLHLTAIFLHGETTACLSVERNRLKSNTWLLFCRYFSVGFLLKEVPSSQIPESSSRMCCCLCPLLGKWGQPELRALHLLRSDFLVSSFQCFSSFHFLMKLGHPDRKECHVLSVCLVCLFFKSLNVFHVSVVL